MRAAPALTLALLAAATVVAAAKFLRAANAVAILLVAATLSIVAELLSLASSVLDLAARGALAVCIFLEPHVPEELRSAEPAKEGE